VHALVYARARACVTLHAHTLDTRVRACACACVCTYTKLCVRARVYVCVRAFACLQSWIAGKLWELSVTIFIGSTSFKSFEENENGRKCTCVRVYVCTCLYMPVYVCVCVWCARARARVCVENRTFWDIHVRYVRSFRLCMIFDELNPRRMDVAETIKIINGWLYGAYVFLLFSVLLSFAPRNMISRTLTLNYMHVNH